MKYYDWRQVKLGESFLGSRHDINREVTIDAVYDRFSDTGRIAAFGCGWKEGDPFRPHIFWDSDVFKWMEAAAYTLYRHPGGKLAEKLESLIGEIERNQRDDGYFNIYFMTVEPEKRFTNRDAHELYCAGHLFEAAVAYSMATGSDRLIKVADRYTDCIIKAFVIEKTAAFDTPGHEEIELALLKLYRHTKDRKYLDLAMHFLDLRGCSGKDAGKGGDYDWRRDNPDTKLYDYNQSHVPVREQRDARGHSVRAVYLYSAMADAACETGDEELKTACDSLFADITEKKMYVTGGIGSSSIGECFTNDFDLPNAEAYTETCAAIGLVFFCSRMAQLHNSTVYSDTAERSIYNGILSGLSLDGKGFFYENPLEISLPMHFRREWGSKRYPDTRRFEVFWCSCCPPNVNRFLASVGGYIYAGDGKTLFVEQYVRSELDSGIGKCRVETDYPLDGKISVEVSGYERVALRIPGWCPDFSLSVPYAMENGYAVFDGAYGKAELELEMKPFPVRSDVRLQEDEGKICIQRGPVVYCAESVDNGADLFRVRIPADFTYEEHTDPLSGLVALDIDAFVTEGSGKLYADARTDPAVKKPCRLRMIPYFEFANREECDMRVWFPADGI